MPRRAILAAFRKEAVYLGLLAVQTAAATVLFWVMFPLFRQMILRIGEPQQVSRLVELEIVLATLILHCAYWARYRWVAVVAPVHSPFLGHLVQFAGRSSFFFGSAVFSVLFFRHLPELAALPSLDQALARGFIVLWVLFALFCYSLELDRLGKAIEELPKPEPPSQS
ncbi:hypothetical protein [Bosea vaviloviae]|uniref:Uncharacterized protein n=1 Tax=Bosea vaviloviae TaxID=1526658 RepID=A0A1D7U609_9HYPH|nr:hypothetical protein [Bosea vaviloviae]AOO82820.1 hypothetical protein BHK69_22425 [Bosea vaviloviae]